MSEKRKVEVYDPPMCCSTGVCGESVDPVLPKFAADLQFLERSGVAVERFNLGQQPAAFVENAAVQKILMDKGQGCLPMIFVDGELVSEGRYPSNTELAQWCGVKAPSAFPIAVGQG
ncbi:MAG: arsenite efflux transporter metallochaperone ArsD [Magnetococcales bacterium]|nr:arsenite efflux transporter metallochaperone ArsD [Magnetococcales bacterium]